MPIPRRHFVAAMATAALPLEAQGTSEFRSQLPDSANRPWIGPEYWSNPLQDWRLRNGRIECIVAGGDRNVFLLTREVGAKSGDLRMSVRLGRLEEDKQPMGEGFAGFRVGSHGHFKDYRDSAVRGFGLDCGIAFNGRMFIGSIEADAPVARGTLRDLVLTLQARPAGATYTLELEVTDTSGARLGHIERAGVAPESLVGGVALVCSSGRILPTPRPLQPMVANGGVKEGTQRGGDLRFWFRDWTISGSKVIERDGRAFGPILFAMHTLSRGVLKITVQMAPVQAGSSAVRLELRKPGTQEWASQASSPIDSLSRTASFRMTGWNDGEDTPYRIRYSLDGREHNFTGTVRRDPKDKPKLLIGALTCNNDFGFPHTDIVRSLEHFKPDLLLFTGDQIYERVCEYGIQRGPLETAALDYLRKWFLFGWSYRDLMRDIPTVALPDDHDMYHGNVWGAGGKKAEAPGRPAEAAAGYVVPPNQTKAWQDDGGYVMSAAWVNLVQRTQTSHLPDPFDATPVQQGITVYYTSMLYGGVSFALLEDRKWKSAPSKTIPWAKIVNGWAQNPDYDAAKHGDVKGAELLGARQIEFLERWASDWSGGAILKIVVSQTIFANLATLPKPANTDDVTPKLPILPLGEFSEGEAKVQDHDSNGWPQSPRNLALRAMRKGVALHIGGDQHLGSTIQYGIDDWNDGPYALCTPSISNLFPRRWYPPESGRNRKPGAPRYTGEFLDGFGNKITVHAVANPSKFGVQPAMLYDRAPGYGILEIDRATRRITFANWPRFVDPSASGARPYDGWPITIYAMDGGLKQAKWRLDRVVVGEGDLVQVVEKRTGEIAYTIRPQAGEFVPKVFAPGEYLVNIFHADTTVKTAASFAIPAGEYERV
jgi:alkaline phosphatase D